MADICTQNLESNNLLNDSVNESEINNDNGEVQVLEQNQDLQNSKAPNEQHPKSKSQKLEVNCQQPNQDEVQSAQSNMAQGVSEIKVDSENVQIEVVEQSPRFNNDESPMVVVNEEILQVETSEEVNKSHSDNLTPVEEPIEYSTTSATIKVEAPVSHTNEVVTFEELNDLKAKVDRVLTQSLINSYQIDHKTTESPIKSYQDSTLVSFNALNTVNPYSKPVTTDYANNLYSPQTVPVNNYSTYSPVPQIRHISDVLHTEKIPTHHRGYSSAYLPTSSEFKPNYDKKKLDEIISRVVGTRNVLSTLKPINTIPIRSPVAETVNSSNLINALNSVKIVSAASPSVEFLNNRNIVNIPKPVNTVFIQSPGVETVKRSAIKTNDIHVTSADRKRSYCGTIEDDIESVVMPHADEPSTVYEEEIVAPIQTVEMKPKELKTPKRIEIINARKQRLGSSAVQSPSSPQKVEDKLGNSVEVESNNCEELSYQDNSSAKKLYLMKSPTKISISHHREHGRQNSMGWSATILESPSKMRISAQNF